MYPELQGNLRLWRDAIRYRDMLKSLLNGYLIRRFNLRRALKRHSMKQESIYNFACIKLFKYSIEKFKWLSNLSTAKVLGAKEYY